MVLLLLLAVAPARASLGLDFDTSRITWRNEGDPAIQWAPLTADGAMSVPLCDNLPTAARSECLDGLRPADDSTLVLEVELAGAIASLRGQLTASIHHWDLPGLLVPLRQAAQRAEAAGVAPALVAQARGGERMAVVLAELWRTRNTLASRDLSLPCDTLQQQVERFNAAAGEPAVRLRRQRRLGICLFCGNVCTSETADRLLADMKAALIAALAQQDQPADPPPAPVTP